MNLLQHRFIRYMDISIYCSFDTCVTKELLQDLGLHAAFNSPRRVGVPERVHTESLDTRLITELVQVRVIGTVFIGFAGTLLDKDPIPRNHTSLIPRSAVSVLQHLRSESASLQVDRSS